MEQKIDNDLFSMILLTWNRLDYTKQTLEGIISTATVRMEIILVDNNSMPESGVQEYLLSMKDRLEAKFERVIYIFNDRNMGVSGGRNVGLSAASGGYLATIDDDVLLSGKWDVLMKEACDNVPLLGVTGVNVEPSNYPIKTLGGVQVRPKNGNLGGACLCLPRRVFKRIGFYNYLSNYGLEDSLLYFRLAEIGLISAYIVPRGLHLDKDADKAYRVAKNSAHKKGSIQMQEMSKYLQYMRSTKDVYVSFDPEFKPVDSDIFTNGLIKDGR